MKHLLSSEVHIQHNGSLVSTGIADLFLRMAGEVCDCP
jgi:hypothetical protein